MLMMCINHEARHPTRATGPRHVRQQGSVADRNRRLGELQSERPEPRAEAGGQDQR